MLRVFLLLSMRQYGIRVSKLAEILFDVTAEVYLLRQVCLAIGSNATLRCGF